MQLFWEFLYFCAKVGSCTCLLFLLGLKITPKESLYGLGAQAAGAFLLSLSVFIFDELYVYPNFRSPFRHLPTVEGGLNSRVLTESPRGKMSLEWVARHPNVNIIHSRGKLGQSLLYPITPDALRDLLSTKCYDFVKPIGLRAYMAQLLGEGLITSEGSMHKQHRRSLNSAFNIKHIRALYPTMWQKAGLFIQRIDEEMQESGSIDIGIWSSRYAFDIIGRALLSREFNALRMASHHPLSEAIAKLLDPEFFMIKFLALYLVSPPFVVDRFCWRTKKITKPIVDYVRAACEDILDHEEKARLIEKEAEPEHNILRKILEMRDLKRDHIVDHMITFIGAGHETSAASITWATHLLTLTENLHYQNILREEVRAAISTVQLADGRNRADFSISEATLQKTLETLPYLNGMCEEILRLYPTVPATMREAIRETSIAGTIVPKGTMVMVMPWTINRNPTYWGEDAHSFRPERWIDTLPDGSRRANKHGGAESNYCEMTFLHGPHACIGRDFAKAELKCALAAIFGHFDVRRLEGDDGNIKIRGTITTKPKGGLKVKMIPIEGW